MFGYKAGCIASMIRGMTILPVPPTLYHCLLAAAADGGGHAVMRGYLDDPAATAEAIDPDGWLHTGDLGTIDDHGHLRIVGRKKDMFIVGGFNAYRPRSRGSCLSTPPSRCQGPSPSSPSSR